MSLINKTILLTRARHQSSEIKSLLESSGATVVDFPTIEIVEPESWDLVDSAIERLSGFDWIIFTSSNAVRFFVSRINTHNKKRFSDLNLVIKCAIGPKTAQAIRDCGLKIDTIANDSRAEGVLDTIVKYANKGEGIAGLRILIPRSKTAREYLPEGLRSLGATVETVTVYRTLKPETDPAEIIEKLKAGHIDTITFTSPSTVNNLAEIAGVDDLSKLIGKTLVACIGPTTASAASELGLKNSV